MILKKNLSQSFGNEPKRSNICPECGEAQVLEWDSVGDGRNITLTSSSHEECHEKYWKKLRKPLKSRILGRLSVFSHSNSIF